MNLADMQVLHAQVISRDASTAHLITARATLDVGAQSASVQLLAHGEQEPFASCKILYEDPQAWTKEWSRVAHLVDGRIRVLEGGEDRLDATTTTATTTRLSRNMAYSVFENVVKYAEAFRGMRSVTLADSQPGEPVEAVATVRMCDLPPDQLPNRQQQAKGGWYAPPQWIDSAVHVGGLALNARDDSRAFFYVTPGWGSMRFFPRGHGKALRPGTEYRSYARMAPLAAAHDDHYEPNMYGGDVYLLQGAEVVGVLEGFRFRRVPRILMDRFFSPAASAAAAVSGGTSAKNGPVSTSMSDESNHGQPAGQATTTAAAAPAPAPPHPAPPAAANAHLGGPSSAAGRSGRPATTEAATTSAETKPVVREALALICKESGLEPDSLRDDALFAELGIDSLMSLVLAEKFRAELGVEVKGSLFLECANVGAFKEWLSEYC